MLSKENHQMFLGIVYGGRVQDGMPSFAEELKPDEVELVHQYIIKRSHDLLNDMKSAKTAANQ